MKKRILSILLTLCMVLSIAPAAVFAEGSTASADITGSGTADDPYLIYTAAGLEEFRDIVNGRDGKPDAWAVLMNDIVLNDGTFDADGNWSESGMPNQWTPIGTYDSRPYSGTFDGKGHTITGLYVKDQQYAGLFGYVVSNTAGKDKFEFTIKDLTVTGYIGINTDSGTATHAGGIVGCADILAYDDNVSGTISNCVSHVIIDARNTDDYSTDVYAGGIVGRVDLVDYNNHTGKMEITNCANYAAITAYSEIGYVYAGGIAGRIEGDASCVQKIDRCFNAGRICGDSDKLSVFAGGIIGYATSSSANNSSIDSCLNVGEVIGAENSTYAGGIAGNVDNISISNCCNAGKVGGNGGGIAKYVNGATVSNCYYLEGTADMAYGGNPYKYGLKTEAEFADGTVLRRLQNGNENSPWEKCGYLNAAGMIVPMLKGQTSDAFLIYTAEDLKTFRDIVNGSNGQTQNAGAHGILMNDIVLNDGTFDEDGNWSEDGTPDQWTPIVGNYGYGGTFDGDGHTIRGLYVKGGEYAGLFGNVWGGTVKNVTVTGYVEGMRFVGGIVGYGNNASITGCTNAAVVKAKCDGSFVDVGGIVGYFFADGNVGNCANLGSVWAQIDSNQGMAKVGGIAGGLGDQNVTIADCYNAGSIAIEDSGTGEYDVVSYLGGIVGSTLMILEPSYISNCYSVGSLTYRGSASAEICGIIGYNVDLFITNCYWLEGTAESGIGGSPRQVTNTSAHTKADFANGTVLELLKGDRTDSPWDVCQYLAAAGMTLPVFKGQGDSHTHSEKTGDCTKGIYCECGYLMHGAESEHNWGEWQHLTTSHTRGCDKPGCGVTQSGNCSGGTATCTEKATCEVCGGKYGEPDPDNHTGRLEWTQTATGHQQEWSCCHVETVAEENHEWENGVCTECHYACAHSGGTATCTAKAVCEICGEKYGAVDSDNHTDITEWIQTETKHTQKYKCCGAVTVAEEDHEWENGVCAECGYGCRHDYEWQSENGKYWKKCSVCNHETAPKDIPTITINGEDKVCRMQDYKFSFTLPEGATNAEYGYEFTGLGDGPLTPSVEDNLYSGIIKASAYPAEENGFKLIVSAKTADGFEFSAEKTVAIQNEHAGGTATCKDKAVCEVCGESYGELDSNNHADLKHIDAKAATKTAEGNIEYWYCDGCGKYFADKDGIRKITKADTVTAKLPDDSQSPQTGDNSNLTLWIALLFISGGAVTATTVYGRKKKRSVK